MAVDFDGTDDLVNCGSAAGIDDILNLTVAAWINFDTMGEGNVGTIADKDGQPTNTGWRVYFSGGALAYKIGFIRRFNTTYGWWNTDGALTVGAWTHVAVTYNKSAVTNDPIIYINGVAVAITERSTPVGTALSDAAISLCFGDNVDSTAAFNGRIEDARVYGRILTPNEIAVLGAGYRGGLGGELVWLPMDSARATTHFDGATLAAATNYLNDLSGNANHGDPAGNPLGYASDCSRLGGITD